MKDSLSPVENHFQTISSGINSLDRNLRVKTLRSFDGKYKQESQTCQQEKRQLSDIFLNSTAGTTYLTDNDICAMKKANSN
jgi:hypothetical protein